MATVEVPYLYVSITSSCDESTEARAYYKTDAYNFFFDERENILYPYLLPLMSNVIQVMLVRSGVAENSKTCRPVSKSQTFTTYNQKYYKIHTLLFSIVYVSAPKESVLLKYLSASP